MVFSVILWIQKARDSNLHYRRLILLATQRERGKGDFLSISLVGGHVEVRYDLGSGPSVLVSSQAVTLGYWHRLVFRRYHQDGMLQIDLSDPVRGKASGRNKSLNIKGAMYVGGHPYMNRTGSSRNLL